MLLPASLMLAFLGLAALHIHWACGGSFGKAVAVPEWQGRPAFTPSRLATWAVAAGLIVCALLVAALAQWCLLPLPRGLLDGLGYALAALFLLRAIGEFRLVGFFKRVRGTRFARLDTLFYSPLCLGIAVGVLCLACWRWT